MRQRKPLSPKQGRSSSPNHNGGFIKDFFAGRQNQGENQPRDPEESTTSSSTLPYEMYRVLEEWKRQHRTSWTMDGGKLRHLHAFLQAVDELNSVQVIDEFQDVIEGLSDGQMLTRVHDRTQEAILEAIDSYQGEELTRKMLKFVLDCLNDGALKNQHVPNVNQSYSTISASEPDGSSDQGFLERFVQTRATLDELELHPSEDDVPFDNTSVPAEMLDDVRAMIERINVSTNAASKDPPCVFAEFVHVLREDPPLVNIMSMEEVVSLEVNPFRQERYVHRHDPDEVTEVKQDLSGELVLPDEIPRIVVSPKNSGELSSLGDDKRDDAIHADGCHVDDAEDDGLASRRKDILKHFFGKVASGDDAQEERLEKFAELVHFSAPILLSEPAAWQIERIKERGLQLGVSATLIDRFIDIGLSSIADEHSLGEVYHVEPSESRTNTFLGRFESAEEAVAIRYASSLAMSRSNPDAIEVDIQRGIMRTRKHEQSIPMQLWEAMARVDDIDEVQDPPENGASQWVAEPVTEGHSSDLKADIDLGPPDTSHSNEQPHFVPRIRSSLTTDSTCSETWIRKRSMATWYPNVNKPRWLKSSQKRISVHDPLPIHGTVASDLLFHHSFLAGWSKGHPGSSQWRLPFPKRVKNHYGFTGVDRKSMLRASSVRQSRHPQDRLPWEHRDVSQRFLYEQSYPEQKNWFGDLWKVESNDVVESIVCDPTPFELPIRLRSEWSEEWYKKAWRAPNENPAQQVTNIIAFDEDGIEGSACGTFRTMQQQIGENISLVTPDLSSSVRRSRWRRKYFAHSSFPYS